MLDSNTLTRKCTFAFFCQSYDAMYVNTFCIVLYNQNLSLPNSCIQIKNYLSERLVEKLIFALQWSIKHKHHVVKYVMGDK